MGSLGELSELQYIRLVWEMQMLRRKKYSSGIFINEKLQRSFLLVTSEFAVDNHSLIQFQLSDPLNDSKLRTIIIISYIIFL